MPTKHIVFKQCKQVTRRCWPWPGFIGLIAGRQQLASHSYERGKLAYNKKKKAELCCYQNNKFQRLFKQSSQFIRPRRSIKLFSTNMSKDRAAVTILHLTPKCLRWFGHWVNLGHFFLSPPQSPLWTIQIKEVCVKPNISEARSPLGGRFWQRLDSSLPHHGAVACLVIRDVFSVRRHFCSVTCGISPVLQDICFVTPSRVPK